MGQLRQKTLNDIYKRLDNTRLSSFNFDIISTDANELLIIKFKENKNYYYKIDKGHNVIFSPGVLKMIEKPQIPSGSTFENALKFIPGWVKHLIDEMEATSEFYEEIESLINDIDQRVSDQEIDSKNKFEPKEQANLEAKIEELTMQFDELKKQNIIKDEELNSIKKDLEILKEDLALFPRGVWLRTASQKILDPLKKIIKSKEVRNQLIDTAKKLLLESIT